MYSDILVFSIFCLADKNHPSLQTHIFCNIESLSPQSSGGLKKINLIYILLNPCKLYAAVVISLQFMKK